MPPELICRLPPSPTRLAPATGTIDAPDFNVDKYVSKMMKDTNLHDLVSKANQLNAEVKALDGDMQMLVYENYNKFISATDTMCERA